ncbi:MAG TPA: tripartite tricarboxylate transporter substrate-binding protein [Candidatus Limnocylindria bacterium]|nr:tripartite tricarboxylate transporter substrate-binding protein [Candidatus Limnocylindria bacterium]
MSEWRRGRRVHVAAVLACLALLIGACTATDGGGAATGGPATTEGAAPGGEAEGGAAEYPSEDVAIMAPADPGGGWDSTARAMQPVVEEVGGVGAEVYNVGGAGGTIGLAQFVEEHAGDPHQLMVMGLVMVGAIQTNDSPVTLEQVTPIASLTSEQEAIVVPADSEYETLEQLVEAWSADPTSISWGGGSAGGTDHILVGLLAEAAGVDPGGINYVAHAGGGEALNAILSGAVTAGVSGVSEFADQVEAGELRWLAVSGEEPPEGIDAPTITEAGFDVVLENWRGVVAPPDIPDADRDAIVQFITEMRDSEAWQAALEENGWADFFHSGDEFDTFLSEEQTRVEEVLAEIGLTG